MACKIRLEPRRNGKVQRLAEYLAGTLTAKENDRPGLATEKRGIIVHMPEDLARRTLRLLEPDTVDSITVEAVRARLCELSHLTPPN